MAKLTRDGSPFLLARTRADWDASAIDPWTLAHVGWGVVLGHRGVGLGATLATAIAWELVEPAIAPLRERSARNKVADVLAAAGGWWLARRIGERRR